MTRYAMACIGVGGYARNYVEAAARLSAEGRARVVALADVDFTPHVETLAMCKPDSPKCYTDYREMLRQERIDVVTIGTGLHQHFEMTIQALAAGCHVILAKPAAVTIQTIDAMIDAERASSRHVVVDFQHLLSGATQQTKHWIASGELGEIQEVHVKAIWRRDRGYYERNVWAGRIMLNGDYVLDGPINNPHSHYIINALYFAHPDRYRFATPLEVQAELYHAKPIEGEDTACIRSRTDTGVVVYVYSTLSRENGKTNEIIVIGEKGKARWTGEHCEMRRHDGQAKECSAERSTSYSVVEGFLRELDGERVELCRLEDARKHILLTNGAYESSGAVHTIPETYRKIEGEGHKQTVCIPGIEQIIDHASENRKLFSEINLPWSVRTRPRHMLDYTEFNMF